MNEILLLDNHEKTRHLYAANLEVYTGANIVEFNNLDDAIEYLNQGGSPNIIITRAKIEQRSADEKMVSMLKGKVEVPLLILGESTVNYFDATIFKDSTDVKIIIQACAKILNVTPTLMVDKDVSDYYPVPLYLLLPGFQLVCPVYKVGSNGEYKEFLKKDHHVYQEVLVMLKDEGLDTIYVKALDRLKFISSLTVQTTEFLRNDRISIEDKLHSTERGHQMVKNMAKKMMIDPETIQLAEASIDTMLSIVESVSTLKSLLELTMKNHIGFMYRHCLLTSYISCHLINSMEWGTKDQQVKISFVSFFHDIALQDENLVKIHTQTELEAANLSPSDKKKVEHHAIRSATFLAKYYTSIPMGADIIVKQHHGSRNGIGLDNLSQNISPLSIVFIIAEEWALFAIKNADLDEEIARPRIVNYLRRKYNLPVFKKVLSVLDKISF